MSNTTHGTPALALLLLSLIVPTASAQFSEVRPGARIRLEAPGIVAGPIAGTVLARTADTIQIASPEMAPLSVPIARITSLEISRGGSRAQGAVRGMKWGLPIGLAGGLLAAAVSDSASLTYLDAGRLRTLGKGELVAYSAFAGTLWGAAIGAFIPKERWERFDIAPRSSFDARGGRALIGVGVGF